MREINHTQVIWEVALEAVRARETSLFGQDLQAVPPETTEPEQIILRYDYAGSWRDVKRTLVITRQGVQSFRYQNIHWNDEGENNIDVIYGPADAPTLTWLAKLAGAIRQQRTTEQE